MPTKKSPDTFPAIKKSSNRPLFETCAVLILAAGNSSRLGQPKQLVTYQETPLLLLQIDKALAISNHVICVVGSQAELMQSTIADKNITIVINEDWQHGMASSISTGVKAIPDYIDEVMIILADQWQLSVYECQLLLEQKTKHTNQKIVVASVLHDNKVQIGPPVILSRHYFNSLMLLTGDKGAKPLLRQHTDKLIKVNLPSAFFDLDTPEQLSSLRKYEQQSEAC